MTCVSSMWPFPIYSIAPNCKKVVQVSNLVIRNKAPHFKLFLPFANCVMLSHGAILRSVWPSPFGSVSFCLSLWWYLDRSNLKEEQGLFGQTGRTWWVSSLWLGYLELDWLLHYSTWLFRKMKTEDGVSYTGSAHSSLLHLPVIHHPWKVPQPLQLVLWGGHQVASMGHFTFKPQPVVPVTLSTVNVSTILFLAGVMLTALTSSRLVGVRRTEEIWSLPKVSRLQVNWSHLCVSR